MQDATDETDEDDDTMYQVKVGAKTRWYKADEIALSRMIKLSMIKVSVVTNTPQQSNDFDCGVFIFWAY